MESRVKKMLAVACLLLVTSCAYLHPNTAVLPPILFQDEVLRPYITIGTIEVRRGIFGTVDLPSPLPTYLQPQDTNFAWAMTSLREEAAKMQADAVIFPEVSGSTDTFFFFVPHTEFIARGTAIRFRHQIPPTPTTLE
jgi:hypothetical protein